MSPTLGSLPVNMIVKRFHDVNIFYGKWPNIHHGCLNRLPINSIQVGYSSHLTEGLQSKDEPHQER